MDSLSLASQEGFSKEYINAIEQYLQEVEAVEEKFLQHSESNAEIQEELEELHDKWSPLLDEIDKRETGQN